MSYCVYWIREQSHTDIMTQGYIGVSGNVDGRFASHKGMWSGTNAHLRHAIKKYGWGNLIKSVLFYANKEYCLNIERKLRPAEKIGWNLTIGGGMPPTLSGPQPHLRGRIAWNKGKIGVFSSETLVKMRQAKLGKSPANKGVPITDEHRQKLSKALKGRVSPRKGVKLPPELVERIATKNRGRIQSVEERAMRSKALKGIKKIKSMTDEHKRKIGMNSKGKKWFNNGTISIFCLPQNKPTGFDAGRITPWLCKKEN